MPLTKLEIDRYISTLRTNSKEFNNISNIQLATMLDEVVSNIKDVAFFWSTICSDNKNITKTPAEGEEWLAGPFAAVLSTQYYIETLDKEENYNDLNNHLKSVKNEIVIGQPKVRIFWSKLMNDLPNLKDRPTLEDFFG